MAPEGQFPDEAGQDGEFERQEDAFRSVVGDGGRFPAEAGRYQLYVSLACPWAHRTLIVRKLLGLERMIGMSIADPLRDERGWAFRAGNGHGPDTAGGFEWLLQAYLESDPGFSGRVTVPVLYDLRERRIVNNSEDDICRMFQEAFAPEHAPNLFPAEVQDEQAELAAFIYENVNNGVYRAGFATRQAAYERAVVGLFGALDRLEVRLRDQRFLFGERVVEADWRLFCTLIRFDAVYHGHFKCNLRRIIDYPALNRHLRELYGLPGVAGTVNFDH